jgi:hypothetical protein
VRPHRFASLTGTKPGSTLATISYPARSAIVRRTSEREQPIAEHTPNASAAGMQPSPGECGRSLIRHESYRGRSRGPTPRKWLTILGRRKSFVWPTPV